jgi:hypothetical protein
MSRLVIVAYKPKPGHEAELHDCVRNHVPTLQKLGLATAKTPFIGRNADGTMVEVFEWESPTAIEKAHVDPTVQAMWERFGACCDFLPIGQVPEASQLFSEFATLNS